MRAFSEGTNMKRFALLVMGCALAAIQPPAHAQNAPPALGQKWKVLFRADEPSIWNTDVSAREDRFAMRLSKHQERVVYMRLTNTGSKEFVILKVNANSAVALARDLKLGKYVWIGTCRRERRTDPSGRTVLNYLLGIANKDWTVEYKKGVLMMSLPDVEETSRGYGGWGFAKNALVYSYQAYAWAGKSIPKTVFEIAVTATDLTPSDRQNLLNPN
jgi:hypothetical protein